VRRCGPASGCAGFRRSTPHSDRGGSAVSRPRLGEAHTVGSVHDGSVSLDALVLALASVARLSTVAAVYAMLSAARPIRLLTAYILAGFVVSTGVGIVLVNLLNDSIRRRTPDEVPAVIAFTLAAVSLGYAAGLLSGRVPAPVREPMRTHLGLDSHSWLGRQLTAMSVPRAALAGILTHPPGIFYLAALSAITVSTSSNANRVFQVAVYNAIWFALPIAALVLAIRQPVELQDYLERASEWLWRRQRKIMIAVFGLLGLYLIFRGVAVLQH